MKIPWNLKLHDKTLQQKLNERLKQMLKPFIQFSFFLAFFLMIGILIIMFLGGRWKDPDLQKTAIVHLVLLFSIAVGMLLILVGWPKHSISLVLAIRFFMFIFICMSISYRFECKITKSLSVKTQLKIFKTIENTKTFISNLYLSVSIFVTPFSDKFFVTFLVSSVFFAIELCLINKYGD